MFEDQAVCDTIKTDKEGFLSMTIVYLVRHAVTGVMELEQKKTEPLNDDGEIEAYHLAMRLKEYPIDVFYVSTLKRAKETLEQVKQFHPKRRIVKTHAFDEVEIFNKEGKITKLIDFAPYLKKLEAVCERQKGKKIAIFTHGNMIRGLITEILEARERVIPRLKIHTASITTLSFEKGQFRILGLNDICHLQ